MSALTSEDIRALQNAIYTFGMIVRAKAETTAMEFENHERLMRGEALVYDEKSFIKVLDDCGVNHNSLLTNLYPR